MKYFSGRRCVDARRSCRAVNVTSNPQLPPNKVIGSSAALNQTTNCTKKGSSKKKMATKPKSANETTSTNLARLILNNLNIFSKCSINLSFLHLIHKITNRMKH